MSELTKLYQCPGCGLHYHDDATAKACQAFCSQQQACSLEIAKHSVESEAAV